MSRRRGATLVELLVALALLGIVGTAAVTAIRMQTAVRLRVGSGVTATTREQEALAPLTADLIVASAAGGDIPDAGATDTTLDVQATVATGYTCRDTTDAGVVTVAVLGGAAARAMSVGDTLRLYAGTPASWRSAAIRSVGRAAGAVGCTGMPEIVALQVGVDSVARAGLAEGAPAHVTRRIRYSFYRASDGDTYLGMREWSAVAGRLATVQPVAGPFEPDSAAFSYADSAGRMLAAPVHARDVAMVHVRLGATARVRTAGARTSVTGILGLRNHR